MVVEHSANGAGDDAQAMLLQQAAGGDAAVGQKARGPALDERLAERCDLAEDPLGLELHTPTSNFADAPAHRGHCDGIAAMLSPDPWDRQRARHQSHGREINRLHRRLYAGGSMTADLMLNLRPAT